MDKIFKNKFKNFERKAPDHILGNVLNKVSEMDASKSKLIKLKAASWFMLAAASVFALYLVFSQNNQKQTDESLIIANNKIAELDAVNTTLEYKIKLDERSKKNNLRQESPEVSRVIIEQENINKPVTNKVNLIIEEKVVQTIESISEIIKIIGERNICDQECILELDRNIEGGEWIADYDVQIESPNNSKTIVRCTKEKKVLFTYVKNEQKDTFTVFFNKPSDLEYSIKPETCMGNDGALVFNFPENRAFYSTGNKKLNNNSFGNLRNETYLFKLRDQLSCDYSLQIDIPLEQIKGQITYNALETKLNYPIYFQSKLNIEGLTYEWHFGDGTIDYSKEPNHTFETVGTYSVSLFVSNQICTDTIVLKQLVIEDGALELPNIFTPNNDGKNDIFRINTPSNLLSFEALIMSREGKLVYKWSDANKGWDGLMMNGQKAKSGSYYYIIKLVDDKGKQFEYKSYLELSR